MASIIQRLSFLAIAIGLLSCDSIKSKLVAALDEKIEETGGEPTEAGEPTADAGDGFDSDLDNLDAPPGASKPSGSPSQQQAIRDVTSSSYGEFTSIKNHVVVVDFYADWCGPCRRLTPILKQVVADHPGKVLLGKVDVDKHKEIAGQKGVRGIPDVRIYVNGKEVDRFVGLPPGSMARQKIEAHLGKIKKPSPKPEPKPAAKPQKPEPSTKPTDNTSEPVPNEGQDPNAPNIKPMQKDWLPPGIQRKGT